MVSPTIVHRVDSSMRARYSSHSHFSFKEVSADSYRFATETIPPILFRFNPTPWYGEDECSIDLEMPIFSGFGITGEFLGWMAEAQSLDGARYFRFKLAVHQPDNSAPVGDLAFTHASHSLDLDSATLSTALEQMSYFGSQVRAGVTQRFGGFVLPF